MKKQTQELFTEYPDVVSVKQLCSMLGGIGVKAAYKCLHDGEIKYFRVGKGYRIPKKSVVEYLQRVTGV